MLHALPEKLADEVSCILQDLQLEVKHPSYRLNAEDIKLLKPGQWLSGAVINAYAMLVVDCSSSEVCILDSLMYTSMVNGKGKGIEIGQYEVTARFTSKVKNSRISQPFERSPQDLLLHRL